jgi:hypothetical protein
MFLELGKAVAFLLSLLSLYRVAISAFFVPGSHWEERMYLALARLVIAACVCFASGLLFTWPSKTNPNAGEPLMSTLPVRLFFWAVGGMVVFFVAIWYLRCEGPWYGNAPRDCS